MTDEKLKHNFTGANLLLNSIITYQYDDSFVHFSVPTIRDSIEDPDFILFQSLLSMSVEQYQKMMPEFYIKDRSTGIYTILTQSTVYRESVKTYFEKYILKSKLTEKGIEVEDRPLSLEEYEFILYVMRASFGLEEVLSEAEVAAKLEEKRQYEAMSEMEKRMYDRHQKTLERLQKVKAKQRKNSELEITLEKVVIGVMKEFNYTLEEIKELNFYTLYQLFGYVFKIDHYAFMQMAAANGNLNKNTKLNHWLK